MSVFALHKKCCRVLYTCSTNFKLNFLNSQMVKCKISTNLFLGHPVHFPENRGGRSSVRPECKKCCTFFLKWRLPYHSLKIYWRNSAKSNSIDTHLNILWNGNPSLPWKSNKYNLSEIKIFQYSRAHLSSHCIYWYRLFHKKRIRKKNRWPCPILAATL